MILFLSLKLVISHVLQSLQYIVFLFIWIIEIWMFYITCYTPFILSIKHTTVLTIFSNTIFFLHIDNYNMVVLSYMWYTFYLQCQPYFLTYMKHNTMLVFHLDNWNWVFLNYMWYIFFNINRTTFFTMFAIYCFLFIWIIEIWMFYITCYTPFILKINHITLFTIFAIQDWKIEWII